MKQAAIGLLLIACVASVSAQNTSGTTRESTDQPQVYRSTGARIALGRSIHIAVDEEVSDSVVVVGGSARIDGRVRDGVVVIGGSLDFGPRADVRGDIVVVGGRVTRAPGAQVRGPVTDISFGDWRTWSLGGLSLPVIYFNDFGGWLTLFGTVFRVSLLALLMAVVMLVARAPVARIGRSAAAEPGKAFLLGLAVQIFFVPALIVASLALIITIIGIPVAAMLVPAAILGAFVALILGFTALTCRIGEWTEDRLGWRPNSGLLAIAIGLLLILGPTLLARVIGVAPPPLNVAGWALLVTGIFIEYIVWTVGLGATLMTGFGRWSTAPPPPPAVAPSGMVIVQN
jgi:hypothetical protein